MPTIEVVLFVPAPERTQWLTLDPTMPLMVVPDTFKIVQSDTTPLQLIAVTVVPLTTWT